MAVVHRGMTRQEEAAARGVSQLLGRKRRSGRGHPGFGNRLTGCIGNESGNG